MSERTRMVTFCHKYKVDVQDMVRMCEGHFDDWQISYEAYVRFEMRRRIETGLIRTIDMEDVWGGSHWADEYDICKNKEAK